MSNMPPTVKDVTMVQIEQNKMTKTALMNQSQRVCDPEHEIYNKLVKNDPGMPKQLTRWKNRLAELDCPTLTEDILATAKGIKSHILDTVKHPHKKLESETLPLFRHKKNNSAISLPTLPKPEVPKETHAPIALNLRQKKHKKISLQQEKYKRLHEDYFVSLVECGINIPKDKTELFKTLFLKHYKQQLIFEAIPDPTEELEKSQPNLAKLTAKGKKMDPEEFDKYLKQSQKNNQMRFQRGSNAENEQTVLNLVKSCQSNYNFSTNLLKEDKAYLNELAQDIARKLKLHFNIGKQEELEKQIKLRKMYHTRKMMNKNGKKKEESLSDISFSEESKEEEEKPKSSVKRSMFQKQRSRRGTSIIIQNTVPSLKSLPNINHLSPTIKNHGKVTFGFNEDENLLKVHKTRPKLRAAQTIGKSAFANMISDKISNTSNVETSKNSISKTSRMLDIPENPQSREKRINMRPSLDMSVKHSSFQSKAKFAQKCRQVNIVYKGNGTVDVQATVENNSLRAATLTLLNHLKTPSHEEALDMLVLLNKIQEMPRGKNILPAKVWEKCVKVYEKKYLGGFSDRMAPTTVKSGKGRNSVDSRYDMYGKDFLDYIEDVSKGPTRIGRQYLRKMEISFRDLRNKSLERFAQ